MRPAESISIIGMSAALLTLGCGSSPEPSDVDEPAPGYIRYDTAPISVAAGESGIWNQWVALPVDYERIVVDLTGTQSLSGHHAILYTTTDIQPVGTVRVDAASDQLTRQFVGGVVGQSTELELPEGVVFRVPAGRGLLIQTHYLNVTSESVVGTSRIDVKFGTPSPEYELASLFGTASLEVNLPPQQASEREVSCVIEQDLPLLMFANHMHQWGRTVTTTVTDPNGVTQVLKEDPRWNAEWGYNPNFTIESKEEPLLLLKGSKVSTKCTWDNTTPETLAYPSEMCMFIGFFLGERDHLCPGGTWG